MKFTQVAVIALIAVAMMFVAGCTSESPKTTVVMGPMVDQPAQQVTAVPTAVPTVIQTPVPTTVVPTIELKETTNQVIHYGWGEVTGTVTNNANIAHDVALYVDFYNAQGVKIDHVLDFVSVDAHGTSTFDCTTMKLGTASAKWYVDHFY